MHGYVINGGRVLDGKIKIQSAKNSVLPILAGAILTDKQVIVRAVPKIQDVFSMVKILNGLGVKTRFDEDDLIVDASGLNGYEIPANLCRELRSSVFTLGALLARYGKAKISYPGGCRIGARPIDIHLDGLKNLGAKIYESDDMIECVSHKISGAEVNLSFPSVGATENLMLASVFCKGKTVIKNSAKEPEIVDLMNFLNSMGAKVEGAGTDTVTITGVKRLHGTTYKPIGDRIEAGTYLIGASITGGKIELSGCNYQNISPLINKICNNTCKISVKNDIICYNSGVVRKSFNITTGPFPEFPTDLQAQMTSLATVSNGVSYITERVFETRFHHVPELVKMGANITVNDRTAIVKGVNRLHGATVYARDLRGGASLVLAGLVAEGETFVRSIGHVERGYSELEYKLRSLGAEVKKITLDK